MPHLHEDKLKFLEETANKVRQSIIEMLVEAGSGHSAGPLGKRASQMLAKEEKICYDATMNTKITINKNIRHGKPTIQGTRITAEEVLGALAGGMTFKEIEREYGVRREGVLVAIRYAAGWFRGEEIRPLVKIKA